ncbi:MULTISPECIES: DUF4878 domain-containing protein [unclassified Gilliamella]|uniref:DUF4878 domain-containing protein n=1 Tax=unclassified Gilliamella TaxID=2685620 RepID=UPI00226A2B48|nr:MULTISPECIES: DUF4878 domain-containing protein [unclassified Gilliamella]MCX8641737.1 DUF4878 domain-containing protein [Gilliamella sp. B3835]MCX8706538.1 DUF4878 domain-containing protein [Gilliamella sp. B3783]MCX8708992.1 DUF4878 domain-containing protein [Gilliamella sp. B3780]MCX8712275.1 DUF4878 domain-containing protein [Gilliamella sp. B3468]MCX8714492.1 DUF4878 domain-containing protein [Gilliamella sp. B3781]
MKLVMKFFSVFLLALIVSACSSEESPERTAENCVKAVYSGDLETVINLMYLPEDKTNKNFDMKDLVKSKMQQVIDKAQKLAQAHGGVDKVQASPAEYINEDKTMAKVKTTVFFKDKTQQEGGSASLIKIDGKWLMNFN